MGPVARIANPYAVFELTRHSQQSSQPKSSGVLAKSNAFQIQRTECSSSNQSSAPPELPLSGASTFMPPLANGEPPTT